MENKIVKILTASLFLTLSANSFADKIPELDFPYGHFKESNLQNNSLNKLFEIFVTEIQRKDSSYNSEIEKYNDYYYSEMDKARKKNRYKEPEEVEKALYEVTYEQKDNFTKLSNLFYTEELKSFNSFIQKVKSDRYLTDIEKKSVLESVKELHNSYSRMTSNFKFTINTANEYCFKDPKGLDEYFNYDYSLGYCGDLYINFNNNFAKTVKEQISYSMNNFVNKYYNTKNVGDYAEEMQRKIDEINRNKAFQESQKNVRK